MTCPASPDPLQFAVYDGGGSSGSNGCGSGGQESPYYSNAIDIDITDAPVTFQPSQTPLTATEGQADNAILLGVVLDGDTSAFPSDYAGSKVAWSDDNSTSALSFVGTNYDAYGNPVPQGTVAYRVYASHTFAEEGTVTANVTIQDDGGSSDGSSVAVHVSDAPISVAAQSPNAVVGQQFTSVVGVLADQNPDGPASDFNTTIDWGDGSTSAGTLQPVSGQPGTFDIVGTHTYADFGTYNMVVSAADAGGSAASATFTNYLPAPTITVQSLTLGVGQTLDAEVSVSGQNVAGQSLTIVGYDANVVEVGWDGGAVTDANGNAELAITGLAAGQTNVVVALANFANVQGQGQQQVQHDILSLSDTALTVCTNTGTVADPSAGGTPVTATLTFPNGAPAPGLALEWSNAGGGGAGTYGVNPLIHNTDANGQVVFKIYGKQWNGEEPDDLQIVQSNDPAVLANAEVTVVVPQLTITPAPWAYLTYNPDGSAIPLTVTVTATDPTNGKPIPYLNLDVSLTQNQADPIAFASSTGLIVLTNGRVNIILDGTNSQDNGSSATLTVTDPEAGGQTVTTTAENQITA